MKKLAGFLNYNVYYINKDTVLLHKNVDDTVLVDLNHKDLNKSKITSRIPSSYVLLHGSDPRDNHQELVNNWIKSRYNKFIKVIYDSSYFNGLVREFKKGIYNTKGFSTNNKTYYSCRDIFKGHFHKNNKNVYFRLNKSLHDFGNLVQFINKVEKRLKIKEKTTFFETLDPRTAKIIVSSFWLDHWLKRSLFTLLIRCGTKTKRNESISKGLDRHWYAKSTKKAINKFLNGYTELGKSYLSGPQRGWKTCFYGNKHLDYLKKN